MDSLILLVDRRFLAGHSLSELVVACSEVVDVSGELVDMLVERSDVSVLAVELFLQFRDGLVLLVELCRLVRNEFLHALSIACVLTL